MSRGLIPSPEKMDRQRYGKIVKKIMNSAGLYSPTAASDCHFYHASIYELHEVTEDAAIAHLTGVEDIDDILRIKHDVPNLVGPCFCGRTTIATTCLHFVQEDLHAVELIAEPAYIVACGQEALAVVGYSGGKQGCYAMDQGSKDGFGHWSTFGSV